MSEHDDPQTIDDRARQAAAGLRESASARPVPAFDPDRAALSEVPAVVGIRPRRTQRIVAAAAAVVLVAGAGAWWGTRSDDGGNPPASVLSGDPRPFVAGDLPDGFTLGGAGEVTGDGSDGAQRVGTGPLTVFGPDARHPGLGVAAIPKWDASSTDSDGSEAITSGGRRAFVYSRKGIGRHAIIVPGGPKAVMLLSPTLDEAALLELSKGTSVDGDGIAHVGAADLPDGWREVGQEPDLLGLANPAMAVNGSGTSGKYVVYMRGGITEKTSASDTTTPDGGTQGGTAPDPSLPASEPAASIYVGSSAGDDTRLRAMALVMDETSDLEVRGHDAVLGTSTLIVGDTKLVTRTVSWIERPGELLQISGSTGVAADDLIAVAEGLKPVDQREWKDLVERSQMGEFNGSRDPDTEIGSGRFDDDTRWVLSYQIDDATDPDSLSVQLDIAFAGGHSSSSSGTTGTAMGSSPSDASITALEVTSTGGRSFLGALLADGVARVEIRSADGTVLARPSILEGAGHRGVVAELTNEAAEIVVLSADGKELERSTLTDYLDQSEPDGGGGSSSGSGSSGSSSGSGGSTGSGGSPTTVVGG